ncbi:MAG: alpha/beta hydrolase [Pseudomonadota bacterium]
MTSFLARLLPGRLPPRAIDLVLRVAVKRRLARESDPLAFRRNLEAAAPLMRDPGDARYRDIVLRIGRREVEAVWATAAGSATDDAPVILYLHGGAYLAGSRRTHRHLGAALAGAAGMRALVIDYRLAPEHRLPSALKDARVAWDWLVAEGVPPDRIALAGDSAGGGLALSLLADLTADRQPLPAALVAFSPWADLRGLAQSLKANAESDAMLPADKLREVVGHCLGADGDPTDWRVSPILARFDRPPPAMIFASMQEILLDDALGVVEALRLAGSDPVLELRDGLPHAWPIFRGYLREADAAVAQAGGFLAATIKHRE